MDQFLNVEKGKTIDALKNGFKGGIISGIIASIGIAFVFGLLTHLSANTKDIPVVYNILQFIADRLK